MSSPFGCIAMIYSPAFACQTIIHPFHVDVVHTFAQQTKHCTLIGLDQSTSGTDQCNSIKFPFPSTWPSTYTTTAARPRISHPKMNPFPQEQRDESIKAGAAFAWIRSEQGEHFRFRDRVQLEGEHDRQGLVCSREQYLLSSTALEWTDHETNLQWSSCKTPTGQLKWISPLRPVNALTRRTHSLAKVIAWPGY